MLVFSLFVGAVQAHEELLRKKEKQPIRLTTAG